MCGVCHKKHGKQKWWKSLVETSYQHNAIIPKTKLNSLSNVLSSRTFLLFALKCLKFEWPKQKSLPSFIRFFSQRQIIKYNFINETISFRKFKISHSFLLFRVCLANQLICTQIGKSKALLQFFQPTDI